MRKKVYVNGYFLGNLGDDLFLYILLRRYPNTDFYIFADKNKYEWFKCLTNLKIINSGNRLYNKLYFHIKHKKKKIVWSNLTDVSIMLGGSIFMEKYCGIEELSEIYSNNRYYILGANIGPFETKEYLNALRDICKASYDVCVRDSFSYGYVKDLSNVRCASDIVFNLDKSGITREKKVVISVMDLKKKGFSDVQLKYYNGILQQLINKYREKKYEITAMAFCKREGDDKVAVDLKEQYPFINCVCYDGNIDRMLNEMKNSEVVVATRFHALVLGLLMEKKVIPLIYNEKMTHLLRDVHFDNAIYDLEMMEPINFVDEDKYIYTDVTETIIDSKEQFKKLDEILF